jgi:excinuclease ABC subunit C
MKTLFVTTTFPGFGPNRYHVVGADECVGEQVSGDGRPALRKGIKAQCPNRPGVYAMLDGNGDILYVGKAKRLRTRLLNYFRRSCAERQKAQRLLRRTHCVVWEYSPHEFAALLRELELIRQHRPRFNVMGQPLLRRRAYVCIGRAPAPYVYVANEAPAKGHWFGPLVARAEIHDAVRHLNDLFRLRDCPKRQQTIRFADQGSLIEESVAAGCIRYEIKTCLGPCAALCSAAQYRARVQAVRRFLLCNDPQTLEQMKLQMQEAAAVLDYEGAGVLRDTIESLEWLLGTLVRLRSTREELSFIYPVQVEGTERQLWYLIHEGQLRITLAAPTCAADRRQTRQMLHEIYEAPPRVGIPLEAIDHVWLIAAWFRKFPKERNRCIAWREMLATL